MKPRGIKFNEEQQPGSFESGELLGFFEVLGAFKKYVGDSAKENPKEKILQHPKGMCNNPNCNICKENIELL